jgi:hypothetical protein
VRKTAVHCEYRVEQLPLHIHRVCDAIAPAAESDCHWHKTSSLQSGKQGAIYARKGERPVSTGISEIGSHPKDVERLKHHILWMLLFRPIAFAVMILRSGLFPQVRCPVVSRASYVGAD